MVGLVNSNIDVFSDIRSYDTHSIISKIKSDLQNNKLTEEKLYLLSVLTIYNLNIINSKKNEISDIIHKNFEMIKKRKSVLPEKSERKEILRNNSLKLYTAITSLIKSKNEDLLSKLNQAMGESLFIIISKDQIYSINEWDVDIESNFDLIKLNDQSFNNTLLYQLLFRPDQRPLINEYGYKYLDKETK